MTIETDDGTAHVASEEDRPRRPNPRPPFEVFLMIENEPVTSLERPGGDVDSDEEAAILRQWLDDQGAGDSLAVNVRAGHVTMDQLSPLVATARERGLPIDVHLTDDG